jgi:HK97 gp10 family phage protein
MAKNVVTRRDLNKMSQELVSVKKGAGFVAMRVEGYDSLLDKVQKSIDSTDAVALKGVFVQGARIVRDRARIIAPYDEGRKKGYHLRDAIFAGPGKPELPNALVSVNSNWRSSLPNAPHARMIERGTSKMPANPFFRTAKTQTKAEVTRVVLDGIRKAATGHY